MCHLLGRSVDPGKSEGRTFSHPFLSSQIKRINRNCGKARAVRKHATEPKEVSVAILDSGDALRDSEAGQAHAVEKCTFTNPDHAVGNYNIAQIRAALECIVSDVGHVVANRDIGQACAGSERANATAQLNHTVLDIGHRVGEGDAAKAGAPGECRRPDAGEVFAQVHARQARAAKKRPLPDPGGAVQNREIGQVAAVTECVDIYYQG